MYIHLFVKSQHACPDCFSIAKGLATCRLGGVVSARKSAILSPIRDRF